MYVIICYTRCNKLRSKCKVKMLPQNNVEPAINTT